MKKNVKYLSAAAAALLAVTPVAVSGVANAAINLDGKPAYTSTKPATDPVINVASTMNSQAANTQVSTLTTASAVESALSVNGSNAKVVGVSKAAVVNVNAPTVGVTSLEAGQNYQLQASVALGGLEANKTYTIKQGSESVPATANPNGVIPNVYVTLNFSAYDAAVQGAPYFVDLTTANHVNLTEGAFAYKAQSFTAGETVADLEKTVAGAVQPMVNVDGTNKQLTINYGDVKAQLANQGVTLTSNNTIPASATSFYLTVTATNPANNKTATAKVQFNKDVNSKVYPAIYEDATLVKQGNTGAGVTVSPTTVGSKEAKALAADPIAALKLKAYTIDNKTSGQIDLKVLSNKIDPNTVGVYPVTLTATNPNGYTTTVSFNVVVNPALPGEGRKATVKYKAGYGVNVWNVLSSTNVSFSGKRVMDGEPVTIFGEKTVNGVKYYQINAKNSNDYIQAQYVDGEQAVTPSKPSTDSSKEEAVSGVIVVKYNGRGKVALVNQDGHYGTGNYVSKNAAYKVFAKKTINGKTYYRLGTQNQWIPAQYAQFR